MPNLANTIGGIANERFYDAVATQIEVFDPKKNAFIAVTK